MTTLSPAASAHLPHGGRKRKPLPPTILDVDEPAVPDSTTSSIGRDRAGVDLCAGQDVLLKHKDGRYYLGTVVEVDGVREQCLVKVIQLDLLIDRFEVDVYMIVK